MPSTIVATTDRSWRAGHEQPGHEAGDGADDDDGEDESEHECAFRSRAAGGGPWGSRQPPPGGVKHTPGWVSVDAVSDSDGPIQVALVDDYDVVVVGVANMLEPYRDRVVVAELDTNTLGRGRRRHRALRLLRPARVRPRRDQDADRQPARRQGRGLHVELPPRPPRDGARPRRPRLPVQGADRPRAGGRPRGRPRRRDRGQRVPDRRPAATRRRLARSRARG